MNHLNQPSTVKDWVEHYLKQHAQIDYNRTVRFDGQPSTMALLQSALLLESIDTKSKIPESGLRGAIDIILAAHDAQIVQRYTDKLKFNPAFGDDSIQIWLKAVTGKVDELDVAIVKHFIWQVKRKMMGLDTDYELMPVVCGRTGSGKSKAVERLIAPLKELTDGRDFSAFADTREHFVFTRMYVVLMDEMARADMTEASAYKKIITSKSISWRPLHTNTLTVAPMVSTFIGTSNSTINDIILDTTSARRFWQIDSLDLCDWAAVNSIDYNALWQSVDALAAAPILPYWDRVQAVQHNVLRHKTAVEEWYADGWTTHPTKTIGAKEAYEAFRAWADTHNQGTKVSSTRFGRELTKFPGVTKEHTRTGTVYGIARLPNNPGTLTLLSKVKAPPESEE